MNITEILEAPVAHIQTFEGTIPELWKIYRKHKKTFIVKEAVINTRQNKLTLYFA